MEKKLAVIVDNKEEVTTEVQNTEMCSSACDVAMETCLSQSHDACGDGVSAVKALNDGKRRLRAWSILQQLFMFIF